MPEPCRLLHYAAEDLATNMALEETLFESVAAGSSRPVLRFWKNAPAVAIGISQRWSEMVYADRCRQDGVEIIRRFSGGGTVYHGPGNINYSLITGFTGGIRTSCRVICGLLAEALCSLGLEASVVPVSDVMVNGRKVSGNAQAWRRDVLLHHGTLLLDMESVPVERYLRIPAGVAYASHLDFITNLRREGFRGSEDLLIRQIEAVFADGLHLEMQRDEPSAAELARASLLLRQRYGRQEWNYRR